MSIKFMEILVSQGASQPEPGRKLFSGQPGHLTWRALV